MDDVIFGGSSNRPARDASEVSIVLDNTEVKSLTQFNEYDELEVNRRIERGKGSSWTINSNSVRAKDVNLLFADNSSGARSSGIVSQGQVANLINAKPDARRTLLEEAANITGLHQRRHEAELRLNAAETNLERLGDIVITMEEQKKSLSKQARQASRYKSIGDRLRKAESILLLKKYLAISNVFSSFFLKLAAIHDKCNAAVQLETVIAYLDLVNFLNSSICLYCLEKSIFSTLRPNWF